MRVLLVNPNRYGSPPVPPLGLEYLAASLTGQGHEAEILDLCFSGNPSAEIDQAVRSFQPDMAGVTVRNVDTVLYHTNEFFLDQIKEIVGHLRHHSGLRVVIGGAGLLANPHGILEYLDADYAVQGPAEQVISDILRQCAQGASEKKVFRGSYASGGVCARQWNNLDYRRYFEHGGVAGFETHKGCSSSCVYCLEANTPVAFKGIVNVVAEIRDLVEAGWSHFHLCDSEFNEDNEYATDFCSALKRAGLGIRWALYMKPAYVSKALFRLLKDTGAYLVTLTVDSWKKCPLYWEDYEKCVYHAKANGIRVAVDFLTGFPYETEDTLREHFDVLRRPLPDSIGVNTYIRLYKTLRVTDIIASDPGLTRGLLGATADASLIKPVFYSHVDTARLKELIDGDPLFRIEGIDRGVNYTRAPV